MMTGDAGMPPKTDTVTAMRWTGRWMPKDFRPTRPGKPCPACNSIGTGRAKRRPDARDAGAPALDSGNAVRRISRSIAASQFTTMRIRADGATNCGTRMFANCFCRAILRSRGNIRNLKSRRTEIGSISRSILMAASTWEARFDERIEAARECRRGGENLARSTGATDEKSCGGKFDPSKVWRVNFFRVEGPSEPRFYASWQPTKTPVPQFHVPEVFGKLVFANSRRSE